MVDGIGWSYGEAKLGWYDKDSRSSTGKDIEDEKFKKTADRWQLTVDSLGLAQECDCQPSRFMGSIYIIYVLGNCNHIF